MMNSGERHATDQNQGGIEVLVVLPDVVGVVFCCLFLVHCVEIETSLIVPDGLENILRTAQKLRSSSGVLKLCRAYHFGSICSRWASFSSSFSHCAVAIDEEVGNRVVSETHVGGRDRISLNDSQTWNGPWKIQPSTGHRVRS